MVICKRKSTSSNLALLLKGSPLVLYVCYENLYIASTNHFEHGSIDLVLWFNNLVWFKAGLIILPSINTCWLHLFGYLCWWPCHYKQWSNHHLFKYSQRKDLDKLKYFFRMRYTVKNEIIILQRSMQWYCERNRNVKFQDSRNRQRIPMSNSFQIRGSLFQILKGTNGW